MKLFHTHFELQNSLYSMADSTRPVAPILPPEIINRIIHFIRLAFSEEPSELPQCLQCAPLSLISQNWRYTAQKRLFHIIHITTTAKLPLILAAVQNGMGDLVKILWIDLSNLPQDSELDPQLFRFLLQSMPNLHLLSISLYYRDISRGWLVHCRRHN